MNDWQMSSGKHNTFHMITDLAFRVRDWDQLPPSVYARNIHDRILEQPSHVSTRPMDSDSDDSNASNTANLFNLKALDAAFKQLEKYCDRSPFEELADLQQRGRDESISATNQTEMDEPDVDEGWQVLDFSARLQLSFGCWSGAPCMVWHSRRIKEKPLGMHQTLLVFGLVYADPS